MSKENAWGRQVGSTSLVAALFLSPWTTILGIRKFACWTRKGH